MGQTVRSPQRMQNGHASAQLGKAILSVHTYHGIENCQTRIPSGTLQSEDMLLHDIYPKTYPTA